MKQVTLLLILVFTQFTTFAQKKYSFGIALCNQGQVDNALSQFYSNSTSNSYYYFSSYNYANITSQKSDKINMQVNALASYSLTDSLELRFRLGYGRRISHTELASTPSPSSFQRLVDNFQSFIELTPSIGFKKRFGKFYFSPGFETPFFLIGESTYKVVDNSLNNSNLTQRQVSTAAVSGGYMVGLNAYLNIKVQATKRFFLFSEFNYGVLYSKLGETYTSITETVYSNSSSSYQTNGSSSYSKTLKENSVNFTNLGLQFGVGINL